MGVERCYGEEEIMSNCQMLCKLHKKGKRGERKETKQVQKREMQRSKRRNCQFLRAGDEKYLYLEMR